MATPTHCTIYTVEADFFPWNAALRRPDLEPELRPRLRARTAATCPGQIRPFSPSLAAGTSNPTAGAFSSFSLRLDREDGDQFLGNLNFTMPPGFTGDLRGIAYCPEAAIAAAADNLGRSRAGASELPGQLQIGTTNVAAGPGTHPFHAVGKMYLAGAVQGRAAQPRRRSRRRSPVPMTTAPSSSASPSTSIRSTPRSSPTRTPCPQIIGGIPIRMRSIQVNIDKPQLHDQPDQLLALHRSTPRGSATRARSPTSPPTSTRSTAPPCPSSRR